MFDNIGERRQMDIATDASFFGLLAATTKRCLTGIVTDTSRSMLMALCIQVVLPMVIGKSNPINPQSVSDELILPLAIVQDMIAVGARLNASARYNPIRR